MARAGYCHDCGAYVYLDEWWRCPAGHDPSRVNAWYDSDTGAAIAPAAPSPAPAATAPAAAPAPSGGRDALLQEIMAEFAKYPGYQVAYGGGGDIAIDNHVADGAWATGKKKVDFEALLKAVEAERTVYYWEILKEKGAGLSLGGFEAESYSTMGAKRWGTKKEVIIGPGGGVDYQWDYARTRQIVEAVAARHGWKVKTVLRKGAAQW